MGKGNYTFPFKNFYKIAEFIVPRNNFTTIKKKVPRFSFPPLPSVL